MVKIQIDLSPEEDRIVEIYKLANKHKTKQEAIKKMIGYFKVRIIPKNMEEKDYFYKHALDELGGKHDS